MKKLMFFSDLVNPANPLSSKSDVSYRYMVGYNHRRC
jgi:hypothetical protein